MKQFPLNTFLHYHFTRLTLMCYIYSVDRIPGEESIVRLFEVPAFEVRHTDTDIEGGQNTDTRMERGNAFRVDVTGPAFASMLIASAKSALSRRPAASSMSAGIRSP